MVIKTTILQANVRDFCGEPISENARIIERYSLSEDGVYLTDLTTIHDPENYNKPPMCRCRWIRQPQADIYPYDYDPDSFYRQLYNQRNIKEYFQRSEQRL